MRGYSPPALLPPPKSPKPRAIPTGVVIAKVNTRTVLRTGSGRQINPPITTEYEIP